MAAYDMRIQSARGIMISAPVKPDADREDRH